MESAEQILKNRFQQAPTEIKALIESGQWLSPLTQISGKYNLSQEQAESLKNEVLFVLLGMEPKETLETNLLNNVIPSDVGAKNISSEIKELILKDVDVFLPAPEEPSLQSAPEVKPQTTEVPTQVVVEAAPKAPINLISPEPEEPKLEAPKPEASPVSLAKANSPTIAPLTPKTSEEEKPGKLPETFAKPSAYPQGQDPYREPTI